MTFPPWLPHLQAELQSGVLVAIVWALFVGAAGWAWYFIQSLWKKLRNEPQPKLSADSRALGRAMRLKKMSRIVGIPNIALATALAMLIYSPPLRPEIANEAGEPGPTSSSSNSPTPTQTPIPAPTPNTAPLPVGEECPTPQDAREENRVDLEVYFWCIGPVFTPTGEMDTTQIQLKLRLGITADPRGVVPVDVRTSNPSTLRVLIPYSENLAWTPPPRTAANGDKPKCVFIDGVPYWAIPPNVNDDAQRDSAGDFNFASHWDPGDWGFPDGTLQPNGYIGDDSHSDTPAPPSGRGRTSADLVFTLPVDAIGALYGVTLFDTKQNADPATWTLIGECLQSGGCMTEKNRLDPRMF